MSNFTVVAEFNTLNLIKRYHISLEIDEVTEGFEFHIKWNGSIIMKIFKNSDNWEHYFYNDILYLITNIPMEIETIEDNIIRETKRIIRQTT